MASVPSRRDMYAESTRLTLLETGRQLFLEHGYAAVGTEQLVRAAGLSRGALYHHFGGKQGLFETYFAELEQDAARRIDLAMMRPADPRTRLRAGMLEFLDVCCEHDYREIVLLQGPIALGWPRWRLLDQQFLAGHLVQGVGAMIESGLVRDYPAELLVSTFYGVLRETSLAIADADEPAGILDNACRLVSGLLDAVTVAASGTGECPCRGETDAAAATRTSGPLRSVAARSRG
jgi:AcrR family transcriptional regulator